MELHPTIGARILSGSNNELLMMAEQIALTHHERWDGRGYPSGLSGDDDPASGADRRPSPTCSTRSRIAARTRSRGRSRSPCARSSARPARNSIRTSSRRSRGSTTQRSCSRRPGPAVAASARRGPAAEAGAGADGRRPPDQQRPREARASGVSRSGTRAARRRRPACACRTSASPSRAARACAR